MADDGQAAAGAEPIFVVTKAIDPRTTQPKHSFCVTQGGSAYSSVQLAAATQSNTNWTFSVVPPSTNVLVEKAPMLDAVLTFQCLFLQSDGTAANGNTPVAMDANYVPFAVLGRDWGFGCAAPLGQLVQSWTVTFNNAACQQQSTALQDLTHVLEGPKGRAGHGTNFRIPVGACWDDMAGTSWGLSASIGSMQGEGDVGPGVYNFCYCDGTGRPLPYSAALKYYDPGGPVLDPSVANVPTHNSTFVQYGRPVTNPMGKGYLHAVYIQARFIDSVLCSPLAVNYETARKETGLYGLSTITLLAQLNQASQARIIQGCSTSGCVLMNGACTGPGGTALLASAAAGAGNLTPPAGFIGVSGDLMPTNGGTYGGVTNCRIWMKYISPTIQSTLPPRSISTLLGLQTFQTQVANSSTFSQVAGNTVAGLARPMYQGTVNFSAVSFSCVPDLIMVSVRPDPRTMAANEANWTCTFPDNMWQQFTFANQSGLFSGFTAHDIACMSRANGSRASLVQYGGADGSGYAMLGGTPIVAGGSIILIRPGFDFPLPVGVSVGSTGQVQIAFQLLFNAPGSSGGNQNRSYICTVTAISSGYFVTANGVSRQVLVGLDEVTVLNAPVAPDRFAAQKLAGGNFASGLASGGAAGTEFLSGLKKQISMMGAGMNNRAPPSALTDRAARAHATWTANRANAPGNGVSGGSMGAADYTSNGMGAGVKRRMTLEERLQRDGYS